MTEIRIAHPSRDSEDPRTAGFSLIEMMIFAAIMPIVILASLALVKSGQDADEQARVAAVMVHKLHTTLSRVSEDLRMSGRNGEDVNENGLFDADEDRNGNGRFEYDWDIGMTSVTFNRVLPDGTYSLPITYAYEDTDLVRYQMLDADTEQELRVVVASNVSAFTINRDSDSTFSIDMTVSVAARGGGTESKTLSITVQTRN